MRAYLDAAVVIYLIEQNPKFAPRAEQWLYTNPCDIVSSELVRMECLVQPLRLGKLAVVADFEDFFTNRVVEFAPFPGAVFERATRIRATYNFKTPDALHLAVATEVGYDVFVTNDGRLSAYTDIRVEAI